MPLFSEALKDSKLFSLPPSSVARRIKSANVPKHQTLAAPSASAHRNNWGLKFSVQDAKTKQVEFREFEDRYSTNGTSKFTEFTTKVKNLDFVGAPVTLPSSRRLRSLYEKPQNLSPEQQKQQRSRALKNLSEKEYRNLLAQASEPGFDPKKHNVQFNDSQQSKFIPERSSSVPIQWENSALGASYASPGVLFNLPQGVYSQRWVKGRAMPGRARKGTAVLGGFVATNQGGFSGGVSGEVPWYKVQDMRVSNISSRTDGSLNVSVESDHSGGFERVLDGSTNV